MNKKKKEKFVASKPRHKVSTNRKQILSGNAGILFD